MLNTPSKLIVKHSLFELGQLPIFAVLPDNLHCVLISCLLGFGLSVLIRPWPLKPCHLSFLCGGRARAAYHQPARSTMASRTSIAGELSERKAWLASAIYNGSLMVRVRGPAFITSLFDRKDAADVLFVWSHCSS